MPDLCGEVIPIVKGAINRLRFFLTTSVEEFPRLEEDDWWDYARLIAVQLGAGRCDCGRANCTREHDLSRWDPQEHTLAAFVYRAVIGPFGLKPNSIAQGMLFRLLQQEYGLLLVKVGFKQCPEDSTLYEGTTCLHCQHAFDPCTTPVFIKDWLVIKGVYVGNLRWWACGTGRKAHYYAQQNCREIENPNAYPKLSYHSEHGPHKHDCCPLGSCPRRSKKHGQNGTTIWQRTVFSQGGQYLSQSLPVFMQGVIEGVESVVAQLQNWKYVWVLFLAREDSQAPTEKRWEDMIIGGLHLTQQELYTVAEELFGKKETGALSHAKALRHLTAHVADIAQTLKLADTLSFPRRPQAIIHFEKEELLPQIQTAILQTLQRRGIREEEIQKWLRGEHLIRWQEENDHDG